MSKRSNRRPNTVDKQEIQRMRKLRYWLRAWNGRRRLRHILKTHPEAFKDLFDSQNGIYKHTLAPSEMAKDIFRAVRQGK